MSLLSLIAVFLIEQLQPLDYRRVIAEPLGAWADFIESRFNAGAYRHGVLAWCLAVLLPVLLVAMPLWPALFAESRSSVAAQRRRALPDHGLSASSAITTPKSSSPCAWAI
jgi:hypothetical protein